MLRRLLSIQFDWRTMHARKRALGPPTRRAVGIGTTSFWGRHHERINHVAVWVAEIAPWLLGAGGYMLLANDRRRPEEKGLTPSWKR